jgi:heme-degrading monooxygenase HmoA
MISRHWGAVARREHAAEYAEHLHSETFPAIRRIDGFVDAAIHHRDVHDGVEFVVITRWQSMDSITKFAGLDPEQAVVPPRVQTMMLRFDARVRHYEVV